MLRALSYSILNLLPKLIDRFSAAIEYDSPELLQGCGSSLNASFFYCLLLRVHDLCKNTRNITR